MPVSLSAARSIRLSPLIDSLLFSFSLSLSPSLPLCGAVAYRLEAIHPFSRKTGLSLSLSFHLFISIATRARYTPPCILFPSHRPDGIARVSRITLFVSKSRPQSPLFQLPDSRDAFPFFSLSLSCSSSTSNVLRGFTRISAR